MPTRIESERYYYEEAIQRAKAEGKTAYKQYCELRLAYVREAYRDARRIR